MVEAAGIEPASLDISAQASTYIVYFLNLAFKNSNIQDSSRPVQLMVSFSPHQTNEPN